MSETSDSKKICVITGTRAEYGLLRPLLERLTDHERFELQLIATGTHLSERHGYTVDHIREDGFTVTREIDMNLEGDDSETIVRSMATETRQLSNAFDDLQPDLIIILGDRYELLPVGQVATVMTIPIAHIQGGEVTSGAIDDAIRHSLTKLSHLHFTAAEPYRRRVIQMGENPDRVHTTGTLALDNIESITVPTIKELENELEVNLRDHNFLVVYHPATMAEEDPEQALESIIEALKAFPDAGLIFTAPNADEGSNIILNRLQSFTKNQERAHLFTNLGTERYLRTLGAVDAIIGNSSSGIIEAPYLETPTVNVGQRQEGRLRSESIIDVPPEKNAIVEAVRKTNQSPFRDTVKTAESVYGEGRAAESIIDVLERTAFEKLFSKTFHDLRDTP